MSQRKETQRKETQRKETQRKEPPRVLLVAPLLLLGGCTLGPTELAIILAIVVLLFGASRLPALGKAMGETLRSFKKATTEDDEEKKKLED